MNRDRNGSPPEFSTGQCVDSERIDKSLQEFVSTLLTDSLKSVRRTFRRADKRWNDDPERIHQLRVSCRRALAALSFFAELLPAEELRWFRKKLRSVLSATRHARDLDVLLNEASVQERCAGDELIRELRKQRSRVQGKVDERFDTLIDSGRFSRHLKRLRRQLQPCGSDPHCVEHPRLWILARLGADVDALLQAFPEEAEPAAIHRFRIQAKQLRYSSEFAQQMSADPRIARLNSLLPDLQTQLGEVQDHVAAVEELRNPRMHRKAGHHRQFRRCREYHQERLAAVLATCQEWLISEECLELRETLVGFVDAANSGQGETSVGRH